VKGALLLRFQVKTFVCGRLARLLRFKLPAANDASGAQAQYQTVGVDDDDAATPETLVAQSRNPTTDRLLARMVTEMQALRRARTQRETAAAVVGRMWTDWKLAAAVIDRLLAIVFSVLFVLETFVFFSIFSAAHNSRFAQHRH